MVVVLCYRVYIVANPEPFDNTVLPKRPDSVPREDVGPKDPPPMPEVEVAKDWRPLWRDPLIIWRARTGIIDLGVEGAASQIKLERIMVLPDGKKRAYLRTPGGGSRPRWYDEGAAFESFRLMEIDADTQCCVIFSEADNRPVEICKE
jgi:hypothetical protein